MVGNASAVPVEAAITDDEPASRLESYILGETADERRHRRIVISLPVRFMAEDGDEHRTLLFDMSPGGLSLTSEIKPTLGSRIVLYIEDIGRCEGHVARHHDYGFAVKLIATQNRRDRIAERLTYHANRHRLREEDLRRHERAEADHETRCILPDGVETPCRVIDLSLSGAAIALDPRPELGAEIVIGRMQGQVVRHIPQGVAVRFLAAASSRTAAIERVAGR